MSDYNYKSELLGVSDTWHTISLPDTSFGKMQNALNDIRIFGITSENDTIEVPYLLRKKSRVSINDLIGFKVLNETNNSSGYFFTFEIPSEEPINHFSLNFENKNFDWKLSLEGSQDNKEWFTIVKDHRIISLANGLTKYQFTEVHFPEAKYRYFRINIPTNDTPKLKSTTIESQRIIAADYRDFDVKKVQTEQHLAAKQTIIEVELNQPQAVSHLKLNFSEHYDYFRKLRIHYVTDSTKTEQGWRYNYASLYSGTLSSIDDTGFTFPSTTVQKLKLTILNYDNEPLSLSAIDVKGYAHELTARFTQDASYFLVYGNKNARKPNYDIVQFKNTIPEEIIPLKLGATIAIANDEAYGLKPLFENKVWLWVVMGLICLILGYFSLKMLRK
jgi:hypothetical protein